MGTCSSRNGTIQSYLCHPGDSLWKKELRKETVEALAEEAKNDEQLALFPGRMCCNGASDVACMFTQQGRKGINQDAMLVWEDFASSEGTIFCGVFDGHGPYGHLVARRVRDSLPPKLFCQWHAALSSTKRETESQLSKVNDECVIASETDGLNALNSCEANGPKPGIGNLNDALDCGYLSQEADLFCLWKESHLKAFKVMDKELKVHPSLDCFCSGSTAVTIVKQGQDVIIANVGDSRAILATQGEDNSLVAVQLTVDLKPNLPEEQERIRQCKGRVFSLQDEPEIHRVWLPYDDSPGLAMARSFGDFCLKDYGVISIPEITYRRVTDRDLFIVLASDGVWDVLSNQDAVNIIASAPTRMTAAKTLVESAVRAWKVKHPYAKVDDCAVVCLYLDSALCKSTGVTDEQIDGCYKRKEMPDHLLDAVVKVEGELASQEKPDLVSNQEAQCNLAEYIATDKWCALENSVRVNSLLNLPKVFKRNKRARESKDIC